MVNIQENRAILNRSAALKDTDIAVVGQNTGSVQTYKSKNTAD